MKIPSPIEYLPEGWKVDQQVSIDFPIKGISRRLTGFQAQSLMGPAVVGSGISSPGVESELRAGCELLERICTVEALQDTARLCPQYSGQQMMVGQATLRDLLPGGSHAQWAYSKSNGIAIHTERELAMATARYELVERDAVLQTWFSKKPVEDWTSEFAPAEFQVLAPSYSFRILRFDSRSSDYVFGVFGFPKSDSCPFFCGFSAAAKAETAMLKATDEALQRLGFLWGEEIAHIVPELTATPMYHAEYYAVTKNWKNLRSWLLEARPNLPPSSAFGPRSLSDSAFVYLDITPEKLRNQWYCMQAFGSETWPLVFGQGYYESRTSADFPLHPIA
jgi:hypothetical protein